MRQKPWYSIRMEPIHKHVHTARSVALAIVLFLSGCITNSDQSLNGLLGKSFSMAVTQFGRGPDTQSDLGDGATLYTWRWRIPYTGLRSGLSPRTMYEIVTIWVRGGQITQWQRSAD